jgi:glycosyltransferase involved in cell wall biosynthesis
VISVLILTKNEEVNIARCIASVQWSNDIVVFDSFSTDRTVELATAAGARVIQHAFVDYGSQREAARQVKYRNPWVLAVDADEQPAAELVAEMQRTVAANPAAAAYRMRRRDYFQGRWIKHCTLYPSWFLRLYRPDRIRYEPRAVHEYPTVDGPVGELSGHLIHDNFSKGLEDWYHRHVKYAVLEGAENVRVLNDPSSKIDLPGLVSFSDPVRRRRALKALAMRLPFRPLLRFIYMYVLRGGFLDGAAGLEYCRMIAVYERMIVSFMRDVRNRADSVNK